MGVTQPSTHRLKASGDSEEKEAKGMALRMTEEKECRKVFVRTGHTPSTAFRHLPPNSTRFSYATEGALLVSRFGLAVRR